MPLALIPFLLLAVPVVLGAFVSKLGPWFVLRRTFLALPFVLGEGPVVVAPPDQGSFADLLLLGP